MLSVFLGKLVVVKIFRPVVRFNGKAEPVTLLLVVADVQIVSLLYREKRGDREGKKSINFLHLSPLTFKSFDKDSLIDGWIDRETIRKTKKERVQQ